MPRLILLIFLLLLGCQSREFTPQNPGQDYFPLKSGTYWVYTVLESNITQLGGQISSSYELKVAVADSTTVSSGQVTYILQRFKRPDALSVWVPLDTWSCVKSQFQLVQQEGNIPFIKLAFPLAEAKTWNGNALNNLGGNDVCPNGSTGCDNYSVSGLAKRFEEGTVHFDDTATIIENNDTDPIVKTDVRKSVYGRAIGLIYREVNILEYCTVGDCVGKQIVEKGTVYKQTIKEYVVR